MDNIKVKRNQSISLIRVLAMFLVMLGHILSEFNSIRFIGQILSVGVFIFIFISGFLYGKKNINKVSTWFVKRGIRILVPMYVFMIFFFTIRIVLWNQIDLKYYLAYLLNLQGFTDGVQGAGHLWFLTALMLCYLITPLLNKYKNKVAYFTKEKLLIVLIGLITTQIISVYFINKMFGVYLCYVILYIFAYFFGYLWSGCISKKGLVILTLVTIFAILFRLGSKFILDNSIFYDDVIVLYTQSIFGVWIFIFVSYFRKITNNNKDIINVVKYIDNISFEIFIVHYMFIVGPLRIMTFSQYSIINIVLVFVLSIISGVILHKVCDLIFGTNLFKKLLL